MTRSEESMTRMTSLTDSSGHLYPTPFRVIGQNELVFNPKDKLDTN